MLQRTLLWISLMGGPLGLAQAEDWPQWRGPERTGVSKETGLLPSWPRGGPKLLWTFRQAGAGHSSMCIVGDRLYSMGTENEKDYVFAVDLNTRKKLWSTEVGPRFIPAKDMGSLDVDGAVSTPTIDGNFLYALGGMGNLVCVETASGRKVWSQELVKDLGGKLWGYGYCESPLVDGDQVVVTPCGNKSTLVALDKKTGRLKWRCSLKGPNWCLTSMIVLEVGGIRQYVQNTMDGGGLVGVRASDGKLLWSFNGRSIPTPIHKNDSVYNGRGLMLQLLPDGDLCKAKKIYDSGELVNYYSGVLLVGEHLYGHSECKGANAWVCQDFQTGKTGWRKPRMGLATVIYADGNLYWYDEKGKVRLVQAVSTGYQERGQFCIPKRSKLPSRYRAIWTQPVLANGKLYLRDQDLIFCYDVRKPQ